MFRIEYRISKNTYDGLIGEMGYYKLICNDKIYGDIFSDDLEEIMGTEYLYDWFKEMLIVAIELKKRDYIALSDIESHNIWLEFIKKEDQLYISLVKSEKISRSDFIVYALDDKSYDRKLWKKEQISYIELKCELIRACDEYLKEIKLLNESIDSAKKITELQNLWLQLEVDR